MVDNGTRLLTQEGRREGGMADSGERDGGVVVMCSQYF